MVMPAARVGLPSALAALLVALPCLAAQPAPVLRLTLERPARVMPVSWRHGGRHYHFHYNGRYCNHRVQRHGRWQCR
jgi:hypothetical protein